MTSIYSGLQKIGKYCGFKKFMKLKELFSFEDKWTKGSDARNKWGHRCKPDDPGAISFCLYGAIVKCYRQGNDATYFEISRKISEYVTKNFSNSSYTEFNDTTAKFEDIQKLVNTLDI